MADVLSAAAGVPSAASTEPARRAARAEVDETSMTAAARRYTRRGELRQARKAEADRARLEAAEGRARDPEVAAASPLVLLSGVGAGLGTTHAELVELLSPLAAVAVGLPLGQPMALAAFASPLAAAAACAALHGRVPPSLSQRIVFAAMADPAHERVAAWAAAALPLVAESPALPPGARLELDAVTEAEAAALLAVLPPRSELISLRCRAVTHYGYGYDYGAVALTKAPVPPWPPLVRELLQPLLEAAVAPDAQPLEQLTVTRYAPGDGIAPHVDTSRVFGDHICILSLGSGIVMDLCPPPDAASVENGKEAAAEAGEAAPGAVAGEPAAPRSASEAATGLEGSASVTARTAACHVYLPPRSLLVLGGEARDSWTHGIVPRATDFVNGVVCPRGERISLTFRSVQPEAVAEAAAARGDDHHSPAS